MTVSRSQPIIWGLSVLAAVVIAAVLWEPVSGILWWVFGK
jgi:hypothetical protein